MEGRPSEPGIAIRSPRGRAVILATVLGSGMAFLDGTVVNVALPQIGEDLDAGLAGLQWTVNAYALTLAGLLLLGGALGDRHGRRRMFVAGVAGFALASLLCAIAPTEQVLVAARALQGVAAALLTPTSLAILEATFRREDRGAAIGAWSGLTGVATAIGPLLGGYLVGAVSWRLVFVINLPIAAAVVWLALRHVPETRGSAPAGRLDVAGAVLAAAGLAGVTLGLTAGPEQGWASPAALVPGLLGAAALAGFVVRERGAAAPILPLGVFRSRTFTAANLVTLAVYAALGAAFFLLPIQLQLVLGYSPLEAGAALVPVTLVMLLFSARAGRLAQRIGPRLPMTAGPLGAGAGLLMLGQAGPGASYWTDLLPGLLVFAAGLTLTVAPLTATVLGAAPTAMAGVASAVNTTVARTAGLLAVAVVPPLAGISGAGALDPAVFDGGFATGMRISAGLAAAGGLLALATVGGPEREPEAPPLHACPVDAPGCPAAEAARG